MKRFFFCLLATTSLNAIHEAKADLVWASQTGQFGSTFQTATSLTGPSSTIYADSNQYYTGQSADFFNVASQYSTFTLVLTASRVGGDAVNGYYGIDAIDSRVGSSGGGSSGSGQAEGSSQVIATALSMYGGAGVPTITSSGTSPVTLTVNASGTTPSYTIPTSALDPILTFYDDSGATIATVEITDGNSVVVTGDISGQADLNFSVSSPFNYDIQLDAATDVPEPLSAALLGFGVAGAIAARRRVRMV